ncbi:MAG: VCBS repeat-containing protein [Candidatus Latescibacterota bacterium]
MYGDYDNDGDLDLFVAVGSPFAVGKSILLRNDRGTFRDVALEAGLTGSLGTDNAVWLDYDRDGYLDLYIGNPGCGTLEQPVYNLLYRNRGDGTFEDVTERAGLMLQLGSTDAGGCGGGSNGGMAAGDFNDDGWPDLYVAVFSAPNRLFLNDGQGRFRDATTAEIADPGEAFGVAVGDTDNDGDLDIFQASGGNDDLNLPYRSPLLLNLGQGQFVDFTEGGALEE